MNVTDFLDMLDVVSGGAGFNQWNARCPAHDDGNASLSVSQGEDGRILVNCHAGCSAEEICTSLELTMADLFGPQPHPFRRASSAATPDAAPASSALTVAQLAAAKHLPVEWLEHHGVFNRSGGGVC